MKIYYEKGKVTERWRRKARGAKAVITASASQLPYQELKDLFVTGEQVFLS